MARGLEVIDGTDPRGVARAVRDALAGAGPAVLPREPLDVGALGDPLLARDDRLPFTVDKAVAVVIETSGSSGLPKRVALSADALLASAAATEAALGGPGQWLLALPTHYIAGVQVLVRSFVASTTPVVHPSGHFSAEAFAAHADELEAPLRFTSLVPAQLARLVEAGEASAGIRAAVARFDAILVGGQALPEALHARATELGFTLVRTYGSSETAGGCVYDGAPIGRARVRAVGPDGVGEGTGEIEIAGPMLAEGYLGDDELTARHFRTDGGTRWYRTADAGRVEAGRLVITGRVDNVIISGGVKVSLDRVERLVQGLSGFEQAVVIPASSERWGQVCEVVIEAGDGHVAVLPRAAVQGGVEGHGDTASAAAALERVRAVVIDGAGRAAAPAGLTVVERMPRLASGKPDRAALAASFRNASPIPGALRAGAD